MSCVLSYDNSGRPTGTFYLPTPLSGQSYVFTVAVVGTLTVQAPPGVIIDVGGANSATGGTVASSEVGSTLTLNADLSLGWVAGDMTGQWTVT